MNARARLPRRHFLKTTAAALGAAAFVSGQAFTQGQARYTRYNVTSLGGQKALASYANGIAAMLRLPADNPRNWFRNAFIHIMDCPHGNWWFYPWHRGYIGYLEETIRNLSGDANFAMPYWDWTMLPEIPRSMFDGVLTPTDVAFDPYIRNLSVFTQLIQSPLQSYWNGLSVAQRYQLKLRNYPEFDSLWNDVTGFAPTLKPTPQAISANMAYASICAGRYLSRDNAKLDARTAQAVSPRMVLSGLSPIDFYEAKHSLSFSSSKMPSHNSAPGTFSTLEGLPHNNVHNYVGGVGPLDPGPYGYMTNFLSPADPVFFLHHSNMDRLWDVWTRKQQRIKRPYLPAGAELATLSDEPFLFFVDGNGRHVTNGRAGDYLSTNRFGYDYEPGFPETTGDFPTPDPIAIGTRLTVTGTVKGNTATASVTAQALRSHVAAVPGASLVAEVTVPHHGSVSSGRRFDVIVGAPPGVTQVGADSPYYAGTIAFFGHMNMPGMSSGVTFVVPLPEAPEAFGALTAVPGSSSVSIRIVPSQGSGPAPAINALLIRSR